MRSKSSGVESPVNGVLGVPQGDHDISHEQEVGLPVKSLIAKVQQKEGEDKVEVEMISGKEKLHCDSPEAQDKRGGIMDLSKEGLLKLLGIMEGEVQAREDVICMLKSKPTVPEALELRYGSAVPSSALQALQRDDSITGTEPRYHSVYQKPMVELERLQEKHRETYRRMLGQLLLAEKCHRRTVHELDTEKRKHADYMNKSDDFTNLLEQERERLKRLLENEKAYQVEEMRSQIARNKAIEKGEEESQEEDLQQRCKREETKTRELKADVVALKEKIHELMNKEDQLSQLQVDYSILQQRFLEEEEKAKNMGTEVFHLTKELEVAKRHSRALRPSLNGRRMVDVAVTSTGVQTEALSTGPAEEDTPAVFIRKSVQEENHIMNNLRQKCLKKPTEKSGALERCPSSSSDLGLKKSWIPWMRKKDNTAQETNLEKRLHINGNHLPSELTMSQKQGQPLHIRVTPDHQNNMATLEIRSPTAEDVFSSSVPLSPNPSQPKSRITIIPTYSAPTQKRKSTTGPQGPERAKSPVTITTISRAKSLESSRAPSSSSGRPLSPVSIMTVSTAIVPEASASPEPQEMTMGRAVFKVTPEKQMVPVPLRKGHNNTSIITTTDDNRIHIHLSNSITPKMVVRPVAAVTEGKDMTLSTGTVLRSPRQITTTATRSTQSKVMSSITISPVSSTTSRPTQSMTGHDAQPPRTGLTRIPMSKSLKTGKAMLGSLGISPGVKLESRAESQSMRIEVKKSTVNSNILQNGGKA